MKLTGRCERPVNQFSQTAILSRIDSASVSSPGPALLAKYQKRCLKRQTFHFSISCNIRAFFHLPNKSNILSTSVTPARQTKQSFH
jgi:hypothetical protein